MVLVIWLEPSGLVRPAGLLFYVRQVAYYAPAGELVQVEKSWLYGCNRATWAS